MAPALLLRSWDPRLRRVRVVVYDARGPVHAFMSRTIPNATHHVLPGAGHLTKLEAPEAFSHLLPEFLDPPVARFS